MNLKKVSEPGKLWFSEVERKKKEIDIEIRVREQQLIIQKPTERRM